MKSFELSNKKSKNGRRHFKAILHEIFPDSCVDETGQVGTQYNENGITWIKEYCEKAIESIQGMSLRCEFLDDERTEVCGHGETDIRPEDGLPVFENAVVIGVFDKGYIEEIETPEGDKKTVCIGEGTIDGLCYNNFCKQLDEKILMGNSLFGSVEILKTNGNDGIIYKYGYKDFGRIPVEFEYSGYALLGVRPADQAAKILELNSKEDKNTMDEAQITELIAQVVKELSKCEEMIKVANDEKDDVAAEKNEAVAESEKIKAALEQIKIEYDELNKKYDELWEERNALEKALGEAKARERLGEMDAAISSFSEEEKAYANAEIEAFKANPTNSEINTVVSKIWEGVGKKAKEDAEKIASEQNASKLELEDIFSEVGGVAETDDNCSIF